MIARNWVAEAFDILSQNGKLAEAAAPQVPITGNTLDTTWDSSSYQYNDHHRPICHHYAFAPSPSSLASRALPRPAPPPSRPSAPTQPATPTPTDSPPTTPTRPNQSRTCPTPMPLPSQQWVCATPPFKKCPRTVRSSGRCRRRTGRGCGVGVKNRGRRR